MKSVVDLPFFSLPEREHPIGFVDVGASGGLPAHWKRAEKFLHVTAFEPDERASHDGKQVKRAGYAHLNTALYKEKATLDFYCTRKQENSSVYLPNKNFLDQFPESERFDVFRRVRVSADSLDHQLKSAGITDSDFIKLDTQGSELPILQGASETLRDVFGIEVEVAFAELYEGQPLFSEVFEYLRTHGFALFDLKPYFWKRKGAELYGASQGQVIFADALFLKELDKFEHQCERISSRAQEKSKILRAIAVSVVYGYYEYAFAIFDRRRTLFTEPEAKDLQDFFTGSGRMASAIVLTKLRDRLVWMLELLVQKVAPPRWAKAGKPLGNW